MDARGVGASDSEESMWSLPVRFDGRRARERTRRRRFDSNSNSLDRQTDDDGNDGNDDDDAGRARVRRWGRRGGGVEAENTGVDRGGTSETTEERG